MKPTIVVALLAGAAISTSAFAQVPAAQPAPAADPAAVQPAAQPAVVEVAPAAAPAAAEGQLPAGTEVVLTINEEVNSKTHKLGNQFGLTVTQDVKVDGHVVIPRGTRAVGQILSREGNGSFGKAGKMLIAFRYLDHEGQRIPLQGDHHQKGDSETAETVGAVLAAGVIGGMFVKGKNAKIVSGREFTARTKEAIPVVVPAAAGAPAAIAASYTPSKVVLELPSKKAQKKADAARKKSSGR